MQGRDLWAGIAALAFVLLGTGEARAEGFLDLYLGGAFTQRDDLDFTAGAPGFSASLGARTDFDDSAVSGIRGGYWLDEAPWVGVALDLSGFSPDKELPGNNADIGVIPISGLLMLRAPLSPSDRVPEGHVQPYAAIGPGGFISFVSLDLPGENFVAASVDVGLDIRAGLKLRFGRVFGVFAEYRYTRFGPTWEDELSGVDVDVETTIETHHLNVGIGFHF